MEFFLEISGLLILTVFTSIFIKFIKQPLIVGYIVSGIICGPLALNMLRSSDGLEIFSKIGISILLFIVGLNLNPTVIKEVGKTSVITGVLQVVVTASVGYVISLYLGLNRISAIYTSIALTFSSTIIILKLLSDKGDFHKLYGKIAIGFLLIQDIIASVILLVVSGSSSGDQSSLSYILTKFIILSIIIYVINKSVIPKLFHSISNNQELLFLTSIAWGLGLGSLFYLLGFSVEIGSLVAGVCLSSNSLSFEIASRLKPIRDFFLVMFFVLLGSQLSFENIFQLLPQAIILSLFVLIGNPFIVIIIMNLLGYKRKTSFLSGLTVAQISEFSLILATLGFNLNHLSKETLSLITLIGIITIAVSSYMIIYSERIYNKIEFILKLLEIKKSPSNKEIGEQKLDTILFGFDRVGQHFVNHFKKNNRHFLVVDINPERISILEKLNLPYRFGDASDPDFLEDLNLENIKLVISTIPDFNSNLLLLSEVKKYNKQATFVTISHNQDEAKKLYQSGASFVSIPHYLGAKHITYILQKYGNKHNSLKNEREKHISYLIKNN